MKTMSHPRFFLYRLSPIRGAWQLVIVVIFNVLFADIRDRNFFPIGVLNGRTEDGNQKFLNKKHVMSKDPMPHIATNRSTNVHFLVDMEIVLWLAAKQFGRIYRVFVGFQGFSLL